MSIYKDGRTTSWRRNYVCKLPNGDIMAIYDDVTETKQSELATRMGEQIFRAIANYAYDWEIWVGPDGRVLWMNPAATRISRLLHQGIDRHARFPGAARLRSGPGEDHAGVRFGR